MLLVLRMSCEESKLVMMDFTTFGILECISPFYVFQKKARAFQFSRDRNMSGFCITIDR